MIQPLRRSKKPLAYRIFCSFLVSIITLNFLIPANLSYAQVMPLLNLPLPGSMVGLTPGYNPVLIKGITLYPDNPLEFDFLINSGNSDLKGDALKEEANKLIKYFLASLTVPEQDFWVNLSPYEKDRIIPNGLGITEMGRDLLAQDYILKQLTASLVYPEDNLGKEFWKRVYKKAQEKFGTTDIPLNTFNKIWIVPNKAVVYEKDNNVFVIESSLKVMLEEDYLALQKNLGNAEIALDKIQDEKAKEINKISSDVVREVLLPEIEKEVNEGKNFANLRQIYNSLILAVWYKMNLKESLLGQVYADKNKTKGVDVEDKDIKEKIYQQYLEAFKKGAYDYIKEDYDAATQQIVPRQYFSGGTNLEVSPQLADPKNRIIASQGENLSGSQAAAFQKRNPGRDLRVHAAAVESNGDNPTVVAQAQEAQAEAQAAAEKSASETTDPARPLGEASASAEADDRAALGGKLISFSKTLLTALTLSTVSPSIEEGSFLQYPAEARAASTEEIKLFQAAYKGDVTKLRKLLERGVNVNAKDSENGATPLIFASQEGHTEVVEALLAKGADVNLKKNNGVTALMMASQNGHTEVVEALLAKGVDVNLKANNGATALIAASQDGHLDIVQALLAKNADVNLRDNDGVTALLYASLEGHTEVVKALLDKDANMNLKTNDGETALIYASQNGHTEVVEALLAKGADVNLKEKEDGTALLYASLEGHTEVVEILLAKGANMELKTIEGVTALMTASAGGHVAVVKALLAKGAEVNLRNTKEGGTALMYASEEGHTEIVQALLAQGADVNIKANDGQTALSLVRKPEIIDLLKKAKTTPSAGAETPPSIFQDKLQEDLFNAVMARDIQRVQNLLAQVTDINAKGEFGNTILMYASASGFLEAVKLFIGKGASVNVQDAAGTTPLMEASRWEHLDAAKLLIERGATVNAKDKDGRTALMYASLKGHTDIVQALLTKGADVNLSTNDGKTALMRASLKGHGDVVKLLVEKRVDINAKDEDGMTALDFAESDEIQEYLRSKGAKSGSDPAAMGRRATNLSASLLTALTLSTVSPSIEEGSFLQYPAEARAASTEEIKLFQAADNGDIVKVRELLKHGANVNATDSKNGITALMLASSKGHTEVVEALLAKGADVNLKTNNGVTALLYASLNGHTDIVQALLAKNADVNLKTNDGETALLYASQNGHTKVVEALLAKGADVNLKEKEDWTALMFASLNGHTEVVEALLTKGADVNLKTNDGGIALIAASQNGHTEVVRALLAVKGLDVNLKENEDWTALMFASQNGHTEVVKALLAKDADVNLKANNGATALIAASDNGHTEVVDALLSKGANVDVQAINGTTALMTAAQEGYTAIVKALLAKGADVNLKTNNGETALSVATKPEIIELLKKAGATKGPSGNTDPAAIGSEPTKPVGGINLDPTLLDLQIKRDGNGVPLPLLQQPIGNMNIEGFFPVIINITPVSLPFLLGLNTQEAPTDNTEIEQGKNKFYRDEAEEQKDLTISHVQS